MSSRKKRPHSEPRSGESCFSFDLPLDPLHERVTQRRIFQKPATASDLDRDEAYLLCFVSLLFSHFFIFVSLLRISCEGVTAFKEETGTHDTLRKSQ